jgi:hypothetical protein
MAPPDGPADIERPGPAPLDRSETWAGLRVGDAVEVSDTGIRSATWEFLAHVRNRRTGDEWVEVVGGRPGDRKVRSFPPDRVYPPRGRSKRAGPAPALTDAPRLPFG